MCAERPDRLKRLPPGYYRGHAWVHWVLTVEGRRTGWLEPKFYYRFRELLTHTAFRYQIACPIYCLMPDHLHLLWTGLANQSDQLLAMKRFRSDVNHSLRKIGFEFQKQPYDHVLKEEEIEGEAIEDLTEYIGRNPERKHLVPVDGFAKYPFSGCLMPGAPRIRLLEGRGWEEVWTMLSFLRRTECFRKLDPKYQ